MDRTLQNDLLLVDRVERGLLEEIDTLSAKGLTRLPRQDELTARYGVSIQTIRTVVARLKERKRIRSVKGKGMFILKPAIRKDALGSEGKRLLVAFNAKQRVDHASDAISFYRDFYFELLDLLVAQGSELVLTESGNPRFSETLAKADVIVDIDRRPPNAEAESKAKRVCVFFDTPGSFSVEPDNEAIGRMAVEILALRKGYKRLAVCVSERTPDILRRGDAFLRECHRLSPLTMVESISIRDEPDEALTAFLKRPARIRPEALFIAYGYGVMQALKFFAKQGVSIPKDFAILGFDDYNFYSALPLEVSRLLFSTKEIARAVSYAIQDIAKGREPFKIICRETLYKEGDSLPSPKRLPEG